jgi:hypothetical protein
MISNWTAAEVILAIALLAALMPQEEGFLLPERRDWRGMLRRLLSPAARRLREIQGGRDADDYVRALHQDPVPHEPMIIRQSELPSAIRKFETALLTEPTEGQRPPWETLPFADRPPAPKRREAPTIVMDVVRPAIEAGLGRYLDAYPGYPED